MPKQRKRQTRDVRKRILIICEGEKTEPLYFNGIKKDMRASALNIEISKRPKNSALELIQEAIELKKKAEEDNNSFEYVWVVMDKDIYTKFEETFNLASANNINIAFSSISFELWYLFHFTYTTRPWSSYSEIERALCRHIPDYDKSKTEIYEKLKDKTQTAISNSNKLRTFCKPDLDAGKQVYDLDCYTNVDELVELLVNEE